MRRINASQTVRLRLFACLELALLLLLVINVANPQFSIKPDSVAATATNQLAALPLAFEPNQGQVDSSVQYLVHQGKATTYFEGTKTTTRIGDEQITMSLNGASESNFTSTNQLESKTNYFIGNDQSKWHSDVPNFKQLLAKNVYPGIDLKYYGNSQQSLEHDFIVAPGTDPKQIAMSFEGQKDLSLGTDGALKLKLNQSDVELRTPTTYQENNSHRTFIDSHYALGSDGIVSINVANYDQTQPLIIDPTLSLVYSTYLGGTGNDIGYSIAIDVANNVYISGSTSSTNFPTTSPFQGTHGVDAGGIDTFVTKLNSASSALVYSTYLGGNGSEVGYGIAVDSTGSAYISGFTDSTNFPTASAYQGSNGGGTDAFITKLNAAGSALTYSTYLGGSGSDLAYGIAVDLSGNAYVTGQTTSTNFPTSSPFQGSNGGGNDAFVTKLNAAGSALTYSTYLGGSGIDQAKSIAVDSSNNVYLTGTTQSTNFPTASAFQGSYGGGTDAFITKLNAAGSALTYSTYLGGSGSDTARGIAVDLSGNVYLAGFTQSTNFPTAVPFQATHAADSGNFDAFVTKLNASGSTLVYSTYLGGTATDSAYGIAVDLSGNVYLTGTTQSTNFPTGSPTQGSNSGGGDVFVAKFNTAGSAFTYSTYLGGSGADVGQSIGVDLNGNAYVAGYTTSANFTTASPIQASNGGGQDAFILKITDQNTANLLVQIAPILTFSIGSTTCDLGRFSASQTKSCTHTISASTNSATGYTVSYIPTTTLTSGAYTIDAMASQTASVLATEQFGMNLKANTAAGSFTSANFGADPSGGTGTVMTSYQTANQFKFATGGANIAQTTGASVTTTYTASFIANITIASEAGTYSTPVTYNIVASY